VHIGKKAHQNVCFLVPGSLLMEREIPGNGLFELVHEMQTTELKSA